MLKVRVWGGKRIPQHYEAESNEPIGESWELCDHDEDISCISNGPAKGKLLRELMSTGSQELCGEGIDPNRPDRFPLMLKLLDAQQDLSVQVHPNDHYANQQKPGELGKTEAWIILDCGEGACIYRGLKPGTTKDMLKTAMESGTVDQVLKRIEVKPGEVYHIPAGMIHALGAGVQIAEIQQNSDTTYRLFDWNRTGLDGQPRPLHIEDGLAVTAVEESKADLQTPQKIANDGCHRERLIRCDKFTIERLSKFTDSIKRHTEGESFHLITVVAGNLTVQADEGSENLSAWQSCLLPAACGEYSIEGSDDCTALLFYIEPGLT